MRTAAQLAAALDLPIPTAEQRAVIEGPLAPALVVAGAGAGKTETMAGRVVYLVANGLVRPEQVLGLTFSRKAAAQLGQRVRERLRALAAGGLLPVTSDGSGDPEVVTYHAFGGRIIDDFGPLAGIEPGATVLTPTASWLLARRVVGRWEGELATDLGPDLVTERLLDISGALADHLIGEPELARALTDVIERLESAPPGPRQRKPLHHKLEPFVRQLRDRSWILPLVAAYRTAKRDAHQVDFADQMQIAAELVGAHPQVAQTLRQRYPVVLLDEYQDTGHAQRMILRTLFGRPVTDPGSAAEPGPDPGTGRTGHPVIAVGDPIQSIYSWRGASAANLPRFTTDFPVAPHVPAPTLPLLTSFRNARDVLAVANAVSRPIREDPTRAAVGELRPRDSAPGGSVVSGLFDTVVHEDEWVADHIAARWAQAAAAGRPPPTTAVLLRRRSDMAPVAAALRRAGVPVEVVGLGGLLDEPEIADLVALLRVLVDSAAGAAAIRLLTGPRWMLGMADLHALAARAQELAASVQPAAEDQLTTIDRAVTASLGAEDIDTPSLLDALDDLGPAQRYSAAGHERLTRFAAEVSRLRRRLQQPLPDLIADLEGATGLDVEVQLSSPAGRAHLDAFAKVVDDVAATGAGPVELLDYLAAAADREDGLAPGEVPQPSGAVQVLTVHAAKGLEWEIVAVPRLAGNVFPITRGSTWLSDPGQLPPPLRGDGAELPQLDLPADADQSELAELVGSHLQEFKEHRIAEERRLLYVALTRAETTLLVSGHWWSASAASPAGPSEFLTEIAALSVDGPPTDAWAPAPQVDRNPLTASPLTASWPVDPLGGRRGPVAAGAELVRRAIADQAGGPPSEPAGAPGSGGASAPDDDPWAADVEALIAERRRRDGRTRDVELPGTLTVSALVDLADDPELVARRIVRPVPAEPSASAVRGTAFHRWVERFYAGGALIDVDELPGARDGLLVPDPELDRLRERFLDSPWAARVPMDLELPFSMTVHGVGIRGRADAVFRDADGGLSVVDWKTGAPPPADRVVPAAVQLACYRIALSSLSGLPLQRVRACLYYVGHGLTLAPADLLDADGIAALIGAVATAPPDSTDPTAGPEPADPADPQGPADPDESADPAEPDESADPAGPRGGDGGRPGRAATRRPWRAAWEPHVPAP